MSLSLTYDDYIDRILGGWIGKSIGGTVGARFEGYKGWIEIAPEEMFPDEIPPNDDLDLQILWLKVLEEKGAAITSDDMAQAWLDWCWYPFNEYGIFRQNWRLGIHPPDSGRFQNEFWETGMGCPIRSEIWGYVFPGAPDLAAEYAGRDGVLDHTEESVGAERMQAAMAAMAFFLPDVRRLIEMTLHYLPGGSTIDRLSRAALGAFDRGLSLREARELLLALAGHPEACDARLNVPFTLLALLYGRNDLQETLLCALRCGYDTDCTLATAGALLGQIMGAAHMPAHLTAPIGDQLVMGIAYRRAEMTLSALARDTARVGALFAGDVNTAAAITGVPADLAPLPQVADAPRLTVRYGGLPCAAPGETVTVTLAVEGPLPEAGLPLTVTPPEGWQVLPAAAHVGPLCREAVLSLHLAADLPALPMSNLFTARVGDAPEYTFGVAGAALWRFLGVYFDPRPPEDDTRPPWRLWQHHYVDLGREYLPEPEPDADTLYARWSRMLGRPAVVAARERTVDLAQVTGLQGEYVAYLDRTVFSPEDRDVLLAIGNTDGFRLYLNDELVGEADEQPWWSPFNHMIPARLRAGENRVLVKLAKRGETLKWTLGIRLADNPAHNATDWCVDLSDVNPLAR